MELTSSHIDRPVPCFDPDCVDATGGHSQAEPEQDGDLTFYCCRTCGGEFGYHRVTDATCAAGLPLNPQPRPPLLQIGRHRAPAS